MDSMSMETVHTMIKAGKTNPGPVGKVMKILIHGIHHLITIMENMNTNHLYKRKPGSKRKSKDVLLNCKRKPGSKRKSKNVLLKDYKRKPSLRQQSKSALLNYCKRVSWTVLKQIARIRKSFKLKIFFFLKLLRRKKKKLPRLLLS